MRFRIVYDWRYQETRAYPDFHKPTYTAWEHRGFVDAKTAPEALAKANNNEFVDIDREAEGSINSALNYAGVVHG